MPGDLERAKKFPLEIPGDLEGANLFFFLLPTHWNFSYQVTTNKEFIKAGLIEYILLLALPSALLFLPHSHSGN